MIKFTVNGAPVGKGRPKFTNINGFSRAYTPKKTADYEKLVKQAYIQEKHPKLTGYIKSIIHAFFPIPKSTSKKKREQMLFGEIRPNKKPDLDNIAKIILDSLNGVAYDDDSQIVSLDIMKFYDDIPHVEVYLSEV